jgi:protein gp37
MAKKSKIEWTESTWNPVTGCTKISPGCKNCYAEKFALRLKAAHNPSYINGFQLTLHERVLCLPLRWSKPQSIFVNSMSDLFHEEIPDEFIFDIFEIMNRANWHRFQILTKRSDRLLKLNPKLNWAPHIWMGVSVEDSAHEFRVNELLQTNAAIKFLSLEPLLGQINGLNLAGIDWVIAGGESGPFARPMESQWVTTIRDQCQDYKVPFFFKQWGGVRKKKAGRELEGRTWDEMPFNRSIKSINPLAALGSEFI